MEVKRLRLHIPDWLKAITLVVALFLLYTFISFIINTIILFLIGAIFAYILHPFVNWLVKRGIPRSAAVLLVFVAVVLLVALFVIVVTPSLSQQIKEFSKDLPEISKKLGTEYERFRADLPPLIQQFAPEKAETLYGQATEYLRAQASRLAGFASSALAALSGFVILVIFAVYILLHLDDIDTWFRMWIPEEYHWLYDRLVGFLDVGYGRYVVGQVIISVTFGFAVGVVTAIFGLPFPIILGAWAGVIQIIPIIGPAFAVIPPILLAFIESLRTGVGVTVVLLLITLLQGTFLTPYILGAAITISPMIIVFFIIAGAEIGGVGGTILAIPFLVALNLIWQFIKENIYYGPGAPLSKMMMLATHPPESPQKEEPPEEKPDEPGDKGPSEK